MANKGRRMVFEEDIKKIGQGGGATYTAGTGISIDADNEISANIKAGSGIVVDTDLTDDSLVVMVDDSDIAYKIDTPDLLNDYVTTGGNVQAEEETDPVTGDKTFKISTNPISYPSVPTYEFYPDDLNIYVDPEDVDTDNKTVDISDFINGLPLLQTDGCTDFVTLPNPIKFSLAKDELDNPNKNYFLGKGLFLMKDTANNKYIIIEGNNKCSNLSAVPTGTTARPITGLQNIGYTRIFRSGSNDYTAYDRRCQQYHKLYIDDTWAAEGYKYKVNGVVLNPDDIVIITCGRTYDSVVNFSFSGAMGKADLSFMLPNKNGSQTHIPNSLKVPTTQGTYTLQVTVDENGAIDTFSWVQVNN